MQLVKTIGGSHGLPAACVDCTQSHFVSTGLGWSCGNCGHYVPMNFRDLKKDLEKMKVLHGNLKAMVDGLERLVQSQKAVK